MSADVLVTLGLGMLVGLGCVFALRRLRTSSPPAVSDRELSKPIATLVPGSRDPELEALVQAGKLVDAIKLYRARHGVGLKEAKDAVERMLD